MTAAFCAEKALRGLFAQVIPAAVPSKKAARKADGPRKNSIQF
mgnify:CR=1 FL=1